MEITNGAFAPKAYLLLMLGVLDRKKAENREN
jgi:hypothetical protein